jgi:hypothetical protein
MHVWWPVQAVDGPNKTHSFKLSMVFSFQDRNVNSLGIKDIIFITLLFIFHAKSDAILGFIYLSTKTF